MTVAKWVISNLTNQQNSTVENILEIAGKISRRYEGIETQNIKKCNQKIKIENEPRWNLKAERN